MPKATPAFTTGNLRILVVDDHRVVAQGLHALLECEPDFEVVGTAHDGREALRMIEEIEPHVVVIDVAMPSLNGIEATTQIVRDHPSVRVVALSTHAQPRMVRSMLEAGAMAYVTKDTAGEELVRALQQVRAGRMFVSSDLTGVAIDGMLSPADTPASPRSELGAREREVLQLIAEGLTSGEIASRLYIASSTVDTHRKNLMRKLEIHSIAGLTKYAIREGITPLDQ